MSLDNNDNSAETRAAAGQYWTSTLRLTVGLLLVWGAVSFLPGWFADELNSVVFFGWPFGFYMAAQGALIVFLVIVWLYDFCMTRLERRHGLNTDE
ncbi:MAG: DUF4212 domain-containing protein [Zoogloea sp.]|jgi:putative solute:sodium symporter small subunit|nr:DUF4212 domain-containing protein [Zoogloea sp.]